MTTVIIIVVLCAWYTGLLDAKRLQEGIPSIIGLIRESMPPNFQDAHDWFKPLVDTLAMSVAGTALAVVISMPLSLLAARNTSPHPVVYHVARSILNGLRSIPELIMGILFVAPSALGHCQVCWRWDYTRSAWSENSLQNL